MKRTLSALIVLLISSQATATSICDAWQALFHGCPKIEAPVSVDFVTLKNVTNTWYTPYTTHPLWKKNYCGETSYIITETAFPGVEHQYYLKKDQIESLRNEPRSAWHKIINHYVSDENIPGVSYWKADIKIDLLDVWVTAPETTSYALVVDPSPSPMWWAAFYCSSTDRGLFTKGLDIRSAYLPLEPEIFEIIKGALLAKGIDQHELDKLYEAPYEGCIVKDADGEDYIYP